MAEAVSAQKTRPGVWYRYRYLVFSLLTCNAAIAAYMLLTREPPKLKLAPPAADEVKKSAAAGDASQQAASLKEEPKADAKAVVREKVPIPRKDQVELYKWMLAEKRKVKPSSAEEKRRLDSEKALLKDYIRGKLPLIEKNELVDA